MHPRSFPATLSLCLAVLASVLVAPSVKGAATVTKAVFKDDFSSTSLSDKPNGYLGGWYGNHVAFGEWVKGDWNVQASGGALQVSTTGGFRGAAVLLSPALFKEAGSYTLSFDISNYSGESNNSASVSIWSGKGYDLTNSSANALILDAQNNQLRTEGSASSVKLASANPVANGSYSINFTYDGTSAVALFLGATTNGWPFPSLTYDNVSVAPVVSPSASPAPPASAVPELSTPWALGVLLSFGGLTHRRRRS